MVHVSPCLLRMSFFKSFVGWFAVLTAADVIKEFNSGTGIGYRQPRRRKRSFQDDFADWREENKEELSKKSPFDIWQQNMRDNPEGDHSEAWRKAGEWLESEQRRIAGKAKKYGVRL